MPETVVIHKIRTYLDGCHSVGQGPTLKGTTDFYGWHTEAWRRTDHSQPKTTCVKERAGVALLTVPQERWLMG